MHVNKKAFSVIVMSTCLLKQIAAMICATALPMHYPNVHTKHRWVVLQVASPKQELPSADLVLCVYLPGLPPEQLSLRVRPGAPQRLRLHPDHPWTPQVG